MVPCVKSVYIAEENSGKEEQEEKGVHLQEEEELTGRREKTGMLLGAILCWG